MSVLRLPLPLGKDATRPTLYNLIVSSKNFRRGKWTAELGGDNCRFKNLRVRGFNKPGRLYRLRHNPVDSRPVILRDLPLTRGRRGSGIYFISHDSHPN